jgi:hypothetical protein
MAVTINQPLVAISTTSQVPVSYAVASTCSFKNLPATINLNAQGGQPFYYSINFNINCNTNSTISLTLSSLNAQGTQMRLKSASQNKFINYIASVNGTAYPSGSPQIITPNAASYPLYLSFAAPDFANTFKDALTFTLTY